MSSIPTSALLFGSPASQVHNLQVRRLSYGPAPDQYGDLWLPEGPGPFPVVVNLHGGYWRDRFAMVREDARLKSLVGQGFAGWNIEFRRSNAAEGRPAWPDILWDVAAGIDYLAELSGNHDLDLGRVVFVGYSAGGQLALWAAARAQFEPGAVGADPKVLPIGAIGLASVTDMVGLDDGHWGEDAVAEFFHGVPGYAVHRDACSPLALLPLGIPQLFVHGAQDERVPLAHTLAYEAKARGLGDQVTMLILPNVSHFTFPDTESSVWRFVSDWIRQLVATERAI